LANSNTAGLTKIGAGTLTLSGSNNYSGPTSINGGMLEASTTAALPYFASAGSLSVASSATLAVAVGGAGRWQPGDISNLLNNSGAFLSGAALGIDTAGGSFTYAGAIVNSGLGLTKLGGNMLTLGGSNTYTGPTTITAGTLSVASLNRVSGGVASSSLGAPTTAANGTITFGNGGTLPLHRQRRNDGPRDLRQPQQQTQAIENNGSGALTWSGSFGYIAGPRREPYPRSKQPGRQTCIQAT